MMLPLDAAAGDTLLAQVGSVAAVSSTKCTRLK